MDTEKCQKYQGNYQCYGKKLVWQPCTVPIMFANFAIKLFGTIDDFFVKKSIFPAFFERERLFRYRLIIIRKFFLYHFKVKQFHRKFYLWLFKGGLISESFSLGYIYKKMCKITSMYSKHRYLNSLGRWWSGWWFSIFFGSGNTF